MKDLLPDLCDHYEQDIHLLPIGCHDYGGKNIFYGQCVTLRCFEDNSLVRDILSQDGTGKVLFIDGHGSCRRALLGDQLALLAIKNNWQGIIVNGAVRDIATLATLNLGVKALGGCPIKTVKRQMGELNVTLNISEKLVYPGDYIYADLNGIILSKQALDLSVLSG
ncbi:putative 4-hydroxy-4-methyl-2-oxoglutarate aldolase [Photobacterium angustum]|uniref:putative 4-hydroxy-4-methyl-2-oxoglutarate aldolase n=1 Tax=Photobacterium angustum TaxID=661 RepID=UPI0005E4A339|nr:putative 4-hydroxy-4-methyl-2-oxoglutarate aldolase [Photobacterium angustum]KJG01580.1 ribonuclease activity regulator protein RraA [Photobacterium angustum]KJG17237.1 ribonuclease activity regulator protein RraA [Photobacterium angustum]KJG23622.1 ribonuclease activity regulator protein RraA [Photobacterium angustum]KJG30742.1 ribonuclease activity regulator protein RraA [Photobacterium angustum]PSV66753.1 putative 4-hydroxy-4-methyl-2-oxoglutarate aldolase [Photobacterium angustum]